MLIMSRALCSVQSEPDARKDTPLSKAEAQLTKKMRAAQAELKRAQARFDAACTDLIAERRAQLSKKLAKQGVVKGAMITDGARLWGYDGVVHDRHSKDPAAVCLRLLLVRKRSGEIGKVSVPVPRNIRMDELRPVRDEQEVANIRSKGELLGGYWTDYPIEELGDEAGQVAPIRPCQPLSWGGDKYAWLVVEGVEVYMKAGYVYTLPGRSGAAPVADLSKFPKERASV